MKDRICIICGQPLLGEPLMTLDHMPASAQDIPDRDRLSSERHIKLDLCQCTRCGLVQFDCEPVEYYRDVIRSGGFSTTMVELRRRQYRHLIEGWKLEGKKFLEAGCGQGEFLSVLSEFPVEAYGIENRRQLAELARSRGLKVWQQFAEEGARLESVEDGYTGPYDVFLSFNFLEHQPEPVKMLRCIWENLTQDGMGLVTVPSLEYILQYDGYYELLRDHLAYYTFDSLRAVLGEAGFEVLEEEMVNRDTLSVIVRKVSDERKRALLADQKAFKPVDISGLKRSRITIGEEIRQMCSSLKRQGKTLAVWGASHQGFTLAATTVLGEEACYIIDSAPFKQGLYAPASHLPIKAPESFFDNPVDAILIAAPGYTEEIAGLIRERYGERVEIMALKSNHLEYL